jgi:hypothetical protein
MLFGLIYGYFALSRPELLFQSGFLLAIGLALLVSYVFLAKAYWFSLPLLGISTALACYAAGVVFSVLGM